jgi:Bacterial toxin 23
MRYRLSIIGLLLGLLLNSCNLVSHKHFTAYKKEPFNSASAQLRIDGIYFMKPCRNYVDHEPPHFFFFFSDGSLAESTYSYGGKEKQTIGEASYRYGDWALRLSNDWAPLADGGDRFRTGAGQISYKQYSAGFLIHTGDPGLRGKDRQTETGGGKAGTQYSSGTAKDPGLRAGVAYVGYQNYRFGWNSDGIRHAVQNVAIHDHIIKWLSGDYSPWFNRYGRFDVPRGPYFNINANNPFSLWGY